MKRALLCPNCRVVVRDPYTEQLEAELAVALNAELDRPYRPGVTVPAAKGRTDWPEADYDDD